MTRSYGISDGHGVRWDPVFILSVLSILWAAHKAVRAAGESLVMNETSVHLVITDVEEASSAEGDRTHRVPTTLRR